MVSVLGFSNSIPKSAVTSGELNIERQVMALNAQVVAAVASYGPDFGLAADEQICVQQYRKDPVLYCAHDVAASELVATASRDGWHGKYANGEGMGPRTSNKTPMSSLAKWVASVILNFNKTELEPYYYHPDIANTDSLSARGHLRRLGIMKTMCEGKPVDTTHNGYLGPMVKIKDMVFKAENTNTLLMTQTRLKCGSRASWDVNVCYGCSCEQGLASMSMTHEFVSGDASACGSWFTKMDGAIRSYINIVRTQLVAAKTLCCSLPMSHPKRCSKFSFSKAPKQKQTPQSNSECSKSVRTVADCCKGGVSGWKDTTTEFIERHQEVFAASCKYALAVDPQAWPTLAKNFLPVPGFRSMGVDQNLERNIASVFGQNTIMNEAFTCALGAGNKMYSNDLNFAFSPFAGQRYVPPEIKRIHPHVLEISTGFNQMSLGCLLLNMGQSKAPRGVGS